MGVGFMRPGEKGGKSCLGIDPGGTHHLKGISHKGRFGGEGAFWAGCRDSVGPDGLLFLGQFVEDTMAFIKGGAQLPCAWMCHP